MDKTYHREGQMGSSTFTQRRKQLIQMISQAGRSGELGWVLSAGNSQNAGAVDLRDFLQKNSSPADAGGWGPLRNNFGEYCRCHTLSLSHKAQQLKSLRGERKWIFVEFLVSQPSVVQGSLLPLSNHFPGRMSWCGPHLWGGCRSIGVTVQAHTVTQGRTQDWGLGLSCPHPERSVGGAVIWGADQTLLRLLSLPADFFFFKEKASFWYLFVAAAVSWILIKLHLATARHLFPRACSFQRVSFLKTSKFKHKQHTVMKPLTEQSCPSLAGRSDLARELVKLKGAACQDAWLQNPTGLGDFGGWETHKPSLGDSSPAVRPENSPPCPSPPGHLGKSGRGRGGQCPPPAVSCPRPPPAALSSSVWPMSISHVQRASPWVPPAPWACGHGGR